MQITGTNIKMTRGDSESITIMIEDSESGRLFFSEGDTLFFTVKENMNTDKKMLQKVIEIDCPLEEVVIEILSEDTKTWRPKEYIYDIQLTRVDGNVTTIVKPSKFIIEGDVTHE